MNQPKPHVLYIITKLELGGAQKICLSLFNNLDAQTFLISGPDGALVNSVKENPRVFLFKSFTREVRIKGFINEIKNFISLIRHIALLKAQYPHLIVHTHSTKAGLIGRWAAFFAGISYRIHTVHGFAFHEHQNKIAWCIIYFFEWITSFITTHFICVSHADIKLGITLFPRFTQKHSLIRAAVSSYFYTPARKTLFPNHTDTFIFGSIACFKPQKNIFDLLQAFKRVHNKNPHTRLEIIGDGIQRIAIENWIKHHHLDKVITLHGWQQSVLPIMLTWHCFVLSSLWEGLPCAVVEARLLKLPVITYDTGGISDVIQDGKNGFLIPQKQWEQLAHAMLKVSQTPQLHDQLQNYADNLEEFNEQVMLKQHYDLYKKLLLQ